MKNRIANLLLILAVFAVSIAPGEKLFAAEDNMSDGDENYEDYDDEDYDDEDYEDEDYDEDDEDYELEEGDIFTALNGYEYEILTIDDSNSKGTAMLTGTESDKITKLNVPAKVTEEDYGYTFTVTAIDEDACEGYKKLKTVKIPDTVTAIGKEAFENCRSLNSVTIGKKVTSIGAKAFYNDNKLKSIKITSKKLKRVGGKAFFNINKKCVFKVPSSKLKAYQKIFIKQGAGKDAIFKKA